MNLTIKENNPDNTWISLQDTAHLNFLDVYILLDNNTTSEVIKITTKYDLKIDISNFENYISEHNINDFKHKFDISIFKLDNFSNINQLLKLKLYKQSQKWFFYKHYWSNLPLLEIRVARLPIHCFYRLPMSQYQPPEEQYLVPTIRSLITSILIIFCKRIVQELGKTLTIFISFFLKTFVIAII